MADTLSRHSAVLTNTNATTLLTVPNATGDERALVIGLNACNVSSAVADLTVTLVAANGTTISRYAHKLQVAANGKAELVQEGARLVLLAGESLRLIASAGNAFEVTASSVFSE